jgi:hypothetical protein
MEVIGGRPSDSQQGTIHHHFKTAESAKRTDVSCSEAENVGPGLFVVGGGKRPTH